MQSEAPDLDRRVLLAGAAATAALAALGGRPLEAEEAKPKPAPVPSMPVGFVSHGSPMTALSKTRTREWGAWTASMPKPVAVLVVSAHYQRSPVTIGATTTQPLIYDFGGFPKELYRIKYSPPGAPRLARRVQQVLSPLGRVRTDARRGHDHGAWVPLRAMYPRADVPVLSVSLPSHDARALFRMGRALRPLRDEGVFILGSGAMTHNLRYRPRRGEKRTPWAVEFDAWIAQTIEKADVDALLDWQRKAPAARTNHPTVEHFVPLLIAAGARRDGDVSTFPLAGFDGPAASNRCVTFSPPKPRAG